MSTTGFFFIYCVYGPRPTQASLPIFSRVIFTVVRWSARRGLRDAVDTAPQRQNQEGQPDQKFERKKKARRTGLLGETYGYCYRRGQGYIFIAKNYMPQGAEGELDSGGIPWRNNCFRGDPNAHRSRRYLWVAGAERRTATYTIVRRALTFWPSTIFPGARRKSGSFRPQLLDVR